MNSLVSIIVPTFKRSNSLHLTIDSLLKQSYSPLEIIIVDDNGKQNNAERDATKKQVDIIKEKAPNIIYIQLENNSGGAIARNEGIKIAKGEYVSFLDDDDTYHSNKIEKQINVFKETDNPKVAFVKCEMAYVYDNGIVKITNKEKYFDGDQLINHIIDQHAIVGTPTFLFKRSILLEIDGFFNTPIRQEYMLLLRLLSKQYIGVYHKDVLVDIKTSFDGISVGKNPTKAKALEVIYNERMKFKHLLTDEQLSFMEFQFYQDMFRWYSNYDLKNAKIMLLKFKKRISFKEYCSSYLVMYAKYFLGNSFYKLKYLFKV